MTSLREAILAAVEKSGKLDPLIAELERRKARTALYRAKRAAARHVAGWVFFWTRGACGLTC